MTSLSLFTFIIGEGNGNPLQCSCLESPRDGGAWWAAIYGVAQSRTRLKRLSRSSSSSSLLMVQHSYPYMTPGINITLTIWNFVDKVMSLFFNTLPSFVIAILPRTKHLLIPRLLSPSMLILEPKEMKPDTVSTLSPSI